MTEGRHTCKLSRSGARVGDFSLALTVKPQPPQTFTLVLRLEGLQPPEGHERHEVPRWGGPRVLGVGRTPARGLSF